VNRDTGRGMSPPSVKTSGDWMSLFSGRSSRTGVDTSRYNSGDTDRYSAPSTGRYSETSRLSRYSSDSASTRYSSDSRYSNSGDTDRYSAPSTGISDTSRLSRYSSDSASTRYSSDYVPSRYSSRYSSDGGGTLSPPPTRSSYTSYSRLGEGRSSSPPEGQEELPSPSHTKEVKESKSRSKVTVLNEGAIVIKRPGAANTSDEESDSEEEQEEEKVEEKAEEEIPDEPVKDPLEQEEEELNEKLQTAGFLMSLPEEEMIKKRLLEIQQMRDNPDMFKPENSRNFKFLAVSSEVAKPSIAKEEEEKILLLRLSSRGLVEVEQTDIQVRLQEIWRDRREEVTVGIGRVEQHYEHLLNESSTEIAELDGSINNKYAVIAKMQEELLVLSMRKDRLATDMDKVTAAHQTRLEELRGELTNLETKVSTYSVVRIKMAPEESSLPEDERSEIEGELECPVCMEVSRPPIYQCGEGHIICSACKPLLKVCPQCDRPYSDPPIRCRFAEKLAAKYFKEPEEDERGENEIFLTM